MNETRVTWQIGESNAPLPPLIPVENTSDNDNNLKLHVEGYRTYGPIFRVSRTDGPLTILAGPDANVFMAREGSQALSEKQFWQEFDQAYSGQDVGREGEANRMRRAMISPSYSRGRVLDRIPDLVTMTGQYAQDWQPEQCVTFYPWVQNLVAEQLGQLLTHTGTGDVVSSLDTFLSTTMAATMKKSEAKAALQSPAYQQAKERVMALGSAIVAAHQTSPPQEGRPWDLVDDLIQMMGAGKAPGGPASDARMALGALGPFLAGLHTVTTASCFLLYSLLAHPEVRERVMAEIDSVFAQKPLSWERLKTMQAMQGAMMETLRLYPVSTGYNCQATQPFTFAGYRVERGDDVFVAMTVAHFLPELFPEPLTFDIDRYTPPRNEHRQRGAYAPFGLGDHSCLGSGIAEVQLMVTVSTVLFLYQLALDPPDYQLLPLETSRSLVKHDFRIRVLSPCEEHHQLL